MSHMISSLINNSIADVTYHFHVYSEILFLVHHTLYTKCYHLWINYLDYLIQRRRPGGGLPGCTPPQTEI